MVEGQSNIQHRGKARGCGDWFVCGVAQSQLAVFILAPASKGRAQGAGGVVSQRAVQLDIPYKETG